MKGTAIPLVRDFGKDRIAKAKARIKEIPDREHWAVVMEFLKQDSFYHGVNDRGWKAKIDYILKPGVANRILEDMATPKASKPSSARVQGMKQSGSFAPLAQVEIDEI